MEWIDLNSTAALESPLPETARQVQLLLRLGDILMSTTNLQVFCEELLEELADCTDASAGVIFLADAEGSLAPFARVGPISSDTLNLMTGEDGLACIASRNEQAAVVWGDECPRFLPAEASGDGAAAVTGIIAAPLRADVHLVGTIVLQTTISGGFAPEALAILGTVGLSRIARGIESVGTVNVAMLEGERAHARASASRLLMATADPRQRMDHMSEQLALAAGVTRCYIFELAEGIQELVGCGGSTPEHCDIMRQVLGGPIERAGLGLESLLGSRQPTVLSAEDVLADRAFAKELGMRTVLVEPLVYGDQIAGLAYLDEPGEATDFSAPQVEALESISDVAALATHSVHIQKRLAEKAAMERHQDRLSALHYVLNQARIILDEADLVEMLPRSVSDVLGYDRVYMYLVNDGLFELAGCHFRRHEKDAEKFVKRVRRHPPKMGEMSIEVEVYRQGNATLVAEPSKDPRVIKQHQKLLASTSMVVVPLWGTLEVIGVLIADYKYQGLEVTEEDVGLLSLLGTGIGAAIENVRLYEGARRDRDKLATLLSNSDDAIIILDRNRKILAFNKASERLSGVSANEAIGRDCQEVWRCCDEQNRELSTHGCPVASRASGRVTDKTSYTEHVVRTLDDRQIDVASTYAFVEGPDGVIDQSMEILRDLTEHKRWVREHRIADTLQQALLPDTPPGDDNLDVGVFYESATEQAAVGGDFYDFIPLTEGRMGVVIGDVCGKGIDAAHYTAMTKFTLRAFLIEGVAFADAMARLNNAVHAQVESGEFISMCFGVLDTDRNKFTYVNAGHPHPLLLHGNEGWRPLETHGTVLGAERNQAYEDETVSLGAGDTLLFYTDGLVETRRGRNIFGEERLMQFLAKCRVTNAQQFAERIYQRSATFSGGHLMDDVAVVVVRV